MLQSPPISLAHRCTEALLVASGAAADATSEEEGQEENEDDAASVSHRAFHTPFTNHVLSMPAHT